MTGRPGRQFRLEAVLRLASSQEEQLAYRVGALEQACRREAARLADLRQAHRQVVEAGGAAGQKNTVSVARLLQACQYADLLVEQIRAQACRLEEELAALQQWRSALVAASQKRQMLEKLRERHRQRWQRYLDRVELLQATELTAVRAARYREEQ